MFAAARRLGLRVFAVTDYCFFNDAIDAHLASTATSPLEFFAETVEIALRQSALHMVAASVAEDEREHELIVGRRWNVEETVAYAFSEIASIDTPIQPA